MKCILSSILFVVAACSGGLPDESQVNQALSGPCKTADGLTIQCHPSSTSEEPCMSQCDGGSGGYCQETNATEMTFCAQLNNCSNPNYHTYCTWGPTSETVNVGGRQVTFLGCQGWVKDPSEYLHNCIKGPLP